MVNIEGRGLTAFCRVFYTDFPFFIADDKFSGSRLLLRGKYRLFNEKCLGAISAVEKLGFKI
jgi:hypothetical protein